MSDLQVVLKWCIDDISGSIWYKWLWKIPVYSIFFPLFVFLRGAFKNDC
jgi:hypothetical protein